MSKNQSALQQRLVSERARMSVTMEHELRNLRVCVDRAIENLATGQRLDDHLSANYAMLTHEIARWNLLLDLQPYADDAERVGQVKP